MEVLEKENIDKTFAQFSYEDLDKVKEVLTEKEREKAAQVNKMVAKAFKEKGIIHLDLSQYAEYITTSNNWLWNTLTYERKKEIIQQVTHERKRPRFNCKSIRRV